MPIPGAVRRLAPTFLLTLLLTGPAVRSATAGKLTVVVRGAGAGSDRAASLTRHAMQELLAKDERYELNDLGRGLGNPDRERALKAFQAAEEMRQKGREAYETLDLDGAAEYLGTSLARFERYAAYVGDFRQVAEVLLLLGATHILRGEEKLGVRRLEQAVTILPRAEPDPRIFNPAMRNLFQDALVRLGSRPHGSLALTSSPSYAEVYVNGSFMGVTPLVLPKLLEGRHYLRLERDGYRPWGKVVDVVARTENLDSAALKPTLRLDAFDGLADAAVKQLVDHPELGGRLEAAERLGTATGGDQLWLCRVRMDDDRVQLWAGQYDLASHRLLAQGDHVFASDGRAETFAQEVPLLWQRAFGAAALAATGADGRLHSGSRAPSADASCWLGTCSTAKRATVLSTGGAGLAVLVGATVLWVKARGDYTSFRHLPQADVRGTGDYTQGLSLARTGDLLGIVGGFLGLTSGLLALFWEPDPATVDLQVPTVPSPSVRPTALFLQPESGGLQAQAAWSF